MTSADEITRRLKDGGWSPERNGRHELWRHPNGATYSLSKNTGGAGRSLDNAIASISRMERMGPRSQFLAPGVPVEVAKKGTPLAAQEAATGNRARKPRSGNGDAVPLLRSKDCPLPQLIPDSALETKPAMHNPKKPQIAATSPAPSGSKDRPVPWNAWVRQQRDDAGFTRVEVADVMEIKGFNGNRLFKVEEEGKPFHPEEWIKWCEFFQIKQTPAWVRIPLSTGVLVSGPEIPGYEPEAKGLVQSPAVAAGVPQEPSVALGEAVGAVAPAAPVPDLAIATLVPQQAPVRAPEPEADSVKNPGEREKALALAEKRLLNHRITDKEVQGIAADMDDVVLAALLGPVGDPSPAALHYVRQEVIPDRKGNIDYVLMLISAPRLTDEEVWHLAHFIDQSVMKLLMDEAG